MRLPCGHSFCTGCVGELRSKGVSETCPLCRAPLPPGPEKLYELAVQVRTKITVAVGTNAEWPPLSASQQEEMDGAIVMFQEAMDQVSAALGVARWCHADFAVCATSPLPLLNDTPLLTGPHPSSSGHRRHLLLGQRRGGRQPAGDGGV